MNAWWTGYKIYMLYCSYKTRVLIRKRLGVGRIYPKAMKIIKKIYNTQLHFLCCRPRIHTYIYICIFIYNLLYINRISYFYTSIYRLYIYRRPPPTWRLYNVYIFEQWRSYRSNYRLRLEDGEIREKTALRFLHPQHYN